MKYLYRGKKNEICWKIRDVDRKLQIEMNFSLIQVMVRMAKLFVT